MRDRHQVRREGDAHAVAELLLDLGRVAVAADLVGRDRLVDADEVLVVRRLAAGAADARLGVDHHVAEQLGAGERREGEDRGGRVAAGVGDEVGAGDLLAVQLRQPVHGAAHQSGRRVRRRTSPRRRPGRGAGSRQTGRPPARRARAAPRPPAPPRRAGRRRRRRRRPRGDRGRTPRARAARACAGVPPTAARRRPTGRSRRPARSADGGAGAHSPPRRRSRRRPGRLPAQPRGSPPRRSATAASIFARRCATSSSVSVRSSARNRSRRASETRPSAG